MTNQLKNIIIGLFVISACVIVIFLLLFLHPSTGDQGEILHVRFADIDKVNVGTRVTFAGKPVGEVTEIKEIALDRNGPKDKGNHVYVYELTLSIDSGVKVYNTDEITLRTSGLLGERSVAIFPIAPPEGVTPELLNSKDTIYATQVGSVEETMKEFKEVADKLDVTLDNVTAILQDIQKQEIVTKVSQVLENARDITAAINKPEQLTSIINNVQDFTQQLVTRLPKSWDRLDAALDHAYNASESAKTIFVDVQAGKGSAGKILVSDDMYLRLTSILSKGETVMNDINHYGLMFNQDKDWQRLRARRANLLMKLRNPQEFRNFFNDEVDQISTSLQRVNTVLEKSAEMYPCFSQAYNPEFTKVYSELMRRVQDIETSLKMYDEQLVDIRVNETEINSNSDCGCGCPSVY